MLLFPAPIFRAQDVHLYQMNKLKINIKNSIVLVGLESEKSKSLFSRIKDFNLSNSTPIDCMNFLRELKDGKRMEVED